MQLVKEIDCALEGCWDIVSMLKSLQKQLLKGNSISNTYITQELFLLFIPLDSHILSLLAWNGSNGWASVSVYLHCSHEVSQSVYTIFSLLWVSEYSICCQMIVNLPYQSLIPEIREELSTVFWGTQSTCPLYSCHRGAGQAYCLRSQNLQALLEARGHN